MAIIVTNLSGNVGKSTITRHLFKPRLPPSYQFVEVENLNVSGNDSKLVDSADAVEYLDNLISEPETLFDVGASNAKDFLSRIGKRDGIHEDVDIFVIPTIAERKQLLDTVSTVLKLLSVGVPENKILILPNRVDSEKSANIPHYFQTVFNMKRDYPRLRLDASIYIAENEIYSYVMRMKNDGGASITVADLASDTTDYRTLIVNEPNKELRRPITLRLTAVRLARAVNAELDHTFQAIME